MGSSSSCAPVAGSRPNARRARQLPDGRHLHRGRPARPLAWIESATGMHTTAHSTTSATAQPKSSSVSGTFPRRCAYPRPAPVFAPPRKLEEHLARLTQADHHDRPAVLGGSDLHWARRSSPPRPLTRGTPSLCEKWTVRHVVAHVTMPTRLTPAVRGRDGSGGRQLRRTFRHRGNAGRSAASRRPARSLRSPTLHAWQPPGGGATGALNHAVIHSLDITVALGRSAVAPAEAVTAVLDELTTGLGTLFGVDLTSVRLEAADADWSWGNGPVVRADSGLSGRTPERPSAPDDDPASSSS